MVHRAGDAGRPHRSRRSPPRPRPPGGPAPRVIAALPVCVTDDVDGRPRAGGQGVRRLRPAAELPGDARPRGRRRRRPTSPSSASAGEVDRPHRRARPTSASPTSPPSSSAATRTRWRRRGRRCVATLRRLMTAAGRSAASSSASSRSSPVVRRRPRRAHRARRRRSRRPPADTAPIDHRTTPRRPVRRRPTRRAGARVRTADVELTLAWECALGRTCRSTTPTPTAEQIAVAITRPVLDAGDDRRPLVLEPRRARRLGDRARLVLRRRPAAELLDHFYPVGWDPRASGSSMPPIDCGPFDAVSTCRDAADCIAGTGDLLGPRRRGRRGARPRGGAPGARRRAARLPRLQLRHGARRGLRHGPPRRRRAVRARRRHRPDGRRPGWPAGRPTACPTTPPTSSTTSIARFHELCDGDRRSAPPVPTARRSSPTCATKIDDLPTDRLRRRARRSSSASTSTHDGRGCTYDPWSWGLVGDALRDAADGDASTLAALSSYLLAGYPADDVDRRRVPSSAPPTSPSTAPTSATSPRSGAARACRRPIRCR